MAGIAFGGRQEDAKMELDAEERAAKLDALNERVNQKQDKARIGLFPPRVGGFISPVAFEPYEVQMERIRRVSNRTFAVPETWRPRARA